VEGYANKEGMKNFYKRALESGINEKHFKTFEDLIFSSLGLGTYLGEANDETDKMVEEALERAVKCVNLIDTAINYRFQRAERSIGRALNKLVEDKKIKRDEIFISTKNGYLTHDGELNLNFWEYIYKEWISKGLLRSEDISSQYHSMNLNFLKDQFEKSRRNLNLECIDLLYLHNSAEAQIPDIGKEEYMRKLEKVFEFYEDLRRQGKIRYYGLATWSCFRLPINHKEHLNLEEIVHLAKKVDGEGFKFIQLPFNLLMREADELLNQRVEGKLYTLLDAAKILKIGVFTSAPLLQGKLLHLPIKFENLTKAQVCLQFVRSNPKVLSCLVGQKKKDHLEENLKLAYMEPLKDYQNLIAYISINDLNPNFL